MPACGWEATGCDCCGDAFSALSAAVKQSVQDWAVNRLWDWTRQRFGLCEVTFHSDSPECCGATLQTQLMLLNCTTSEMVLPGPIAEPISAIINGEELEADAFRVDDWNILVRVDGGKFQGPWEVTYLRGEPIPPGGDIIAGMLACEYAKGICGDDTCRLPKRVTTITRQGLTMGMIDDFRGLQQGFTGIWEIDDWIATANLIRYRSLVLSPDVPRPRQTTWTYEGS